MKFRFNPGDLVVLDINAHGQADKEHGVGLIVAAVATYFRSWDTREDILHPMYRVMWSGPNPYIGQVSGCNEQCLRILDE